MFSLFGSSTKIGVSIGTSSVKIAELKKSGKSYTLEHFGVAPLPEGAVVNHEIVNQVAVIDALKHLVSELKLKGRAAVASVGGGSVITKKILLEQESAKDLDAAILWEAEQYIPFDINEVAFDYQMINKNGPDGKMEILLVACKNHFIENLRATMKEAGLELSIADLDTFAIENAFEANYPSDTPAAIVHIGSDSLKLVVCANGQPVYTRDSTVGGRSLTNEIQKHMNLSFTEAENIKISGATTGQMPPEVAELMGIAVENIAQEIKRSLDFFSASSNGVSVSYILLTGGGSKILNLQKMVQDMCGLPTQYLNPFTQVSFNAKYFNDESIAGISAQASVPVGLALRGFV